MKTFKLILIYGLGLCPLVFSGSCGQSVHTVSVSNPTDIKRNEIVEVPVAGICKVAGNDFAIVDSGGVEIPYQLTHDSLVVFEVSVAPASTSVYTIESRPAVAKADTVAYGNFFPGRYDDFAWENDRAAYRAYGPALQARGERSFGYDVWTKSVAVPVIEKRYYCHLNTDISYHDDHGEGMDVYSVGSTLGGGTAALLDSCGEIVYPWCFSDYEILDNGPLRFAVRLDYDPFCFRGDTLRESRIITLDKGDFFNRTEVRFEGLTRPADIVSGIVIHRHNPVAYAFDQPGHSVTYADLTDNPEAGHGVIYQGIISPDADSLVYRGMPEPQGDAIGHVLAAARINPDVPYTYYWGSGWSKGFMPDSAIWAETVKIKSESLKNPLKITVK